MKISKLQVAGIVLVVATALAIIALQTSGHGMITTIDNPPTAAEMATHGSHLVSVMTVCTPLSFLVLKWVAVAGVICIVIPFIHRREKTNA